MSDAKRAVKPERCSRCNGTGIVYWGAVINGKPTHQGPCFKCVGGGEYGTTRSAVLWRQQQAQRTTDTGGYGR